MRFIVLAALVLLVSCGPKPDTLDDYPTRPLTLPNGKVLRVETMVSGFDLLRGMMFRKSIAPDHGMLFVHPKPDHYSYWMYQTLIPLDIVWMDPQREIVEIVEDAQPCQTQASKCPQYGGRELSSYALELGAGMARRYNLQVGQRLQW
jgi:uncharacterized protein